MDSFTVLTSIAASIPDNNIDTDIIFPARFLLLTDKKGLGKYAFYEKRNDSNGNQYADFVLNRPPWNRAAILIAGDNFGCGSSREHAPWALHDFGIRCIISTGFGEIFYSNCFQNGILPVVVNAAQLGEFHRDAENKSPLTIDLIGRHIIRADVENAVENTVENAGGNAMEIAGGNEAVNASEKIGFAIADWRREALLNGWDEIAIIRNQESVNIAAFENQQQQRMPWLYSNKSA